MGQSAAELKNEIENTRDNLGETLDAIGDRLSPGRVLGRRRNRLVAGVRRFRERVMGTVGDVGDRAMGQVHGVAEAGTDGAAAATETVREAGHKIREQTQGTPLVIGALAVGAGFLAAAFLPATEAEEQTGRDLATCVAPLKGELLDAGREVAEQLKEPALDAVEQIKDAAKESATDVAEHAKQGATEITEQTRQGSASRSTSQPPRRRRGDRSAPPLGRPLVHIT